MNRSRRLAPVLAVALCLLPAAALAGPPLICFPYQIGDAPCLPFGDDAFTPAGDYDPGNVVDDTLRLLKTERRTLVRMETLRRAGVYLHRDLPRATELLAKVSWIALDAAAAGRKDPEAWFNAAFLAACYRQSGIDLGWKPGVEDGVVG
jgi:hypothetical protein